MRRIVLLSGVLALGIVAPVGGQGAARDKLPKPLDHITSDREEFQRFFIIKGAPRWAKKGEVAGAGEQDTIVWTLEAKKNYEGGFVGSIFGRRLAKFTKGTPGADETELVPRILLRVDDRYLLRRAPLEKGQTFLVWVTLGKELKKVREQATCLNIHIEGR